MIPTLRSMLVATLLTVTVLVGGFGLFAAFRVNHEPLARLPVAATQFQLASVDSAPRAMNFAADQPRLESNDALRAVTAAVSDHDAAAFEEAAPAAASSDTVASTATAMVSAAPERVIVASAPDTAPAQPSDHPVSSQLEAAASPPPPEVAVTPEAAPPESAPPPEAAPQQRTEVAAAPAVEKEVVQQREVAAPVAEAPAAAAASPPEATQPAAVVAVTGPISEMPPEQAAAPKVSAPITPKASAKPAQLIARQAANRRRVAAVRRIHKVRTAPRAQPTDGFSGFGQQANFQSTSDFQSAQSGFGGAFGTPATASRRQKTRTQ